MPASWGAAGCRWPGGIPTRWRGRCDWEIHLFFIVWAATLLLAILIPPRRAWIALFGLAASLLALLPVLNALTTDRPLWRSLHEGDWVFAGLELTSWALAALCVALAWRVARHTPKQAAR